MSWFGRRIARSPYDLSSPNDCITYSLKTTDSLSGNNDIKKPVVKITKKKPCSSQKRATPNNTVSVSKECKKLKPSTLTKQKRQSPIKLQKARPSTPNQKKAVTKDNFI